MNPWGKRIGIGLGILVGLGLAVALIVPALIQVDQYRPFVEQQVNNRINGTVKFGKFSLSLWGQIRIRVEGVDLVDAQRRPLFSVKDADFHIPVASLFSGSPVITFEVTQPTIRAIKNIDGKLNWLALAKPSNTSANDPAPTVDSAAASDTALPAIVSRARLGIAIKEADLEYADLAKGSKTHFKKMNLSLEDISFSRPMRLRLSTDLSSEIDQEGKSSWVMLSGPIEVTSSISPRFQGTEFLGAAVESSVQLGMLDIRVGDLFHKSSQVPFSIQLKADYSGTKLVLDQFRLVFHNAEMTAKGTMDSELSSQNKIDVQTQPIALAPWSELIPMLKSYELSGEAQLAAQMQGSPSSPAYSAHFELKNASAAAPHLKAKPRVQLDLRVTTDRIDHFVLEFAAPGNRFNVTGSVQSFDAPQVKLVFDSPGMDLDQLLIPSPAETVSAAPKAGKTDSSSDTATIPVTEVDRDAQVAPLRANPALRKMGVEISGKLARMQSQGMTITNLGWKFQMRDLVAKLDPLQFGIYGGQVQVRATADLRAAQPAYTLGFTVAGLDTGTAVKANSKMFQNTIEGKLSANAQGEGASFTTSKALKHLKLRGGFKFQDAHFSSLDVGGMVAQALNQAIERVGAQVPQARGKSVSAPTGKTANYESIGADFSIENGVFHMPNFLTKSRSGSGIDLSGDTTMGLLDRSINAKWRVIDTHNVTHAKDISIESQGVSVPELLSENHQPVSFPISVGCKISAPCFQTTEVPEHLIRIALANVGRAVKGKVEREAKSRIQQEVLKQTQNAPAPVKNLLKGLFH